MRVKVGILALLMVGLVLSFATTSQAQLGVTINKDVAYTPAAGDSFVVASFTVTDGGAGSILYGFSFDGQASTVTTPGDIKMFSIYEDKNGDGKYDANDVLLHSQTTSPGNFVGAEITYDTDNVAFAANAIKKYIYVVTIAKTATSVKVFDGLTLTGTAKVAIDTGLTLSGTSAAMTNPAEITIDATNLQFVNLGTAINQTAIKGVDHCGTDGTEFIYAVDDYGNVDVDYDAPIQFTAENMQTGADLTGSLTVTSNAGRVNDMVSGPVDVMSAGVIEVNTGVSQGIDVIQFDDSATTPTPVTLVATAPATSVGKRLVGSTTITSTLYRVETSLNTLTLTSQLVDTGTVDKSTTITIPTGYYTAANLASQIVTLVGTALDASDDDTTFGTFGVTWSSGKLQFRMVAASTAGFTSATLSTTGGTAATTLGIVGTETTTISAAGNCDVLGTNVVAIGYPSVTGVQATRGIEIYDVDHNGYIDHITVIFNAPITLGGVANTDFTIGSGYQLKSGTSPVTNFNAGGYGIRNVGEYGVTLTLAEGTVYDTDVKPEVAYSGSAITDKTQTAKAAPAFGTGEAVEVDKARPVLISARTTDSGVGTGTASNGILDGIIFEFSEPVTGFKAGTNSTGNSLYIDSGDAIVFTSDGTISGRTLTIPVGETTVNTGLEPTIWYNLGVPITDFATAATGAQARNKVIVDNSDYNDKTSFVALDGAPMVVHSVETGDTNGNGRIDQIIVTFSEVVTAPNYNGVSFYSEVAAFSSDQYANGIYDPIAVTTDVKKAIFTIAESGEYGQNPPAPHNPGDTITGFTGVYDTEARPYFRYNPAVENSMITDASGIELLEYGPTGLQHPPTLDGAAPVIVKVITADAYTDTAMVGASSFESLGANGRIDQVKVVFSEQVKTDNGAVNGGTALQNAINQFKVVHPLLTPTESAKIGISEAIGAPVWTNTDNSGDTKTEVTISFQEIPQGTAGMVNGGDTGSTPTVTYTQSTTLASRIKDEAATPNFLPTNTSKVATDGAPPFLAEGMGKGWGSNAFASIITLDSNGKVKGGRTTGDYPAEDDQNGDGYIDGFTLKFTENVTSALTTSGTGLKAFTIDITTGGALEFEHTSATLAQGTAASTWILKGYIDNTKGDPDTDLTPALSFDGKIDIKDTADNKLAAFSSRPSYDGAAPVIVGVNGGDTLRDMVFTFSEPVSAHDTDGKNVSFNAKTMASSALFGYQNLSAGAGASGFTTAAVTQVSEKQLSAKLNADLLVSDIEADLVWVRSSGIYDDANSARPGLADNEVVYSLGGAGIKINIMDDVIAPWVTEIATIDWNGNGKVDHLRFTFSEPINDATLNGYLGADALTADVSANFQISGYTGPAYFNLFTGTGSNAALNAARAAAIAAGEPIFNDNGVNDNILYLKLDEASVPMNALNAKGSTDFKPTITYAGVTLGDFRPNVLDTVADTTKDPDSVGGTVTDKASPVLVEAVWNDVSQSGAAKNAAVGGYVTLYFSEKIKHAGKAITSNQFNLSGSTDGSKIWGFAWIDDATMELQLKSDYAFDKDATKTIGVIDGTNLTDNAATANNQLIIGNDLASGAFYKGALYQLVSPMAATPYTAKANLVAAKDITNTAWIKAKAISDSGPHAGEQVKIEWTYRAAAEAMFDTVQLYESFNNQESWVAVDGATAPIADKMIYWTAKMGVTDVKVAAVGSDAWNFTYSVTVVYDGTNVGGGSIGAPADLVIADVPNDNGGFVIAQFTVSSDHLTAVNSYQFYRQVMMDEADPNNLTWVLWAAVEAGACDDMMKQSVILPTIWDGASNWGVRASTGSVISGATAAAKAASNDILSAMSNIAVGASVDNIAPGAMTDYAINSAGNGIEVSWVAPEDHGVVSSFVFRGATQYVYGVEKYEVYRTVAGSEGFELIGTATPGSTSFIDDVQKGSAVYSYYVKAVDGNPEHMVMSPVRSGISTTALKGDFNGDAMINASDFSIFAANYGKLRAGNETTFVGAYDLSPDGKIDASDFSIFAAAYGSSLSSAKAAVAEMPTSDIPFGISASIDDATSTYFVNVNIDKADGLKGFEFFMSYNTEAFEFLPNSVNGLVGLNMATQVEDGVIRISDWFIGQEFSGTVSLGFRSTGLNRTSTFEILNAVVDVDGLAHATNVSEFEARALPTVYALSQNYPNPFNPTTTIDYSIPKSGNVEMVIYNASGQKVRTLVTGAQDAGFYKVVWDGRNDMGESVASGVYLYKLVSSSFSKTAKMNLIK